MNKPIILFCAGAAALFASCKRNPCDGVNPTDFIPKDSANKMISSYLNSINAPVNDSDLHAICIDMDQLRLYDQQAGSGSNKIIHLKLFLAHKLDYINSGHGNQNAGYNSDALTLVIAGYTAAGNYVYLNGNNVLDHSTPCPHNCPPGQASNDLLP